MDDIGQGLLAILVDIVHAVALGQQHIDLDGDQGVLLAEHVLVLDIQLGTVEGGLVDADVVLHAQIVQDLTHNALGLLPLLGAALVLVVGVGGIPLGETEGALIQQTQRAQAVLGQIQTALELLLQLVGAEYQMALGNGELANADQSVHLAGVLVAEQGGRLAQTHGQVAVGALAVQEHLVLERTGHGTQSKALLGLIVRIAQNEHAVTVVIPVAGDLIELPLGHIGSLGQLIATLLLLILDPALHHLDDAGALGQDDGQALTDIVHGGEILQLAAQLVVVALESLLPLLQVLVQLLLLGEGHGVDALEHLAVAVAAPVGAGAGGQLHGVALDAASGVQMGAGAQVGELTLLIEADDSVLRQVVDELHLIGLLFHFHEADSLLTGQLKPLQLQLLLADLPHLRLQSVQMLPGEAEGRVEIVVEAVVDAGADGQLDLRVQALDGLGQHVGAGVPVGAAVLLVFKGVQVFFGHGFSSFSLGAGIKRTSPLIGFRGEVKMLYSTVPPCLRHAPSLVISVTGEPVPAY